MAVHSAPYRHNASGDGGSHSAGSWSALLLLERAVTATSEAAWPWSLAYASLRADVHAEAPAGGERHSKHAIFGGHRRQRTVG